MWGYSSYACACDAHPGTLALRSSVGEKYKETGKGSINNQVSYCLRLFPLTITECLGWGNSYRASLFKSMVSRDRKAKNRMPAPPSCVRTLCCSHSQTLENCVVTSGRSLHLLITYMVTCVWAGTGHIHTGIETYTPLIRERTIHPL